MQAKITLHLTQKVGRFYGTQCINVHGGSRMYSSDVTTRYDRNVQLRGCVSNSTNTAAVT